MRLQMIRINYKSYMSVIFVCFSSDAIAKVEIPVGQAEYSFVYTPGQPPDHLFSNFPWADKLFGYAHYKVDRESGEGWHRLLVTNDRSWFKGATVCSMTKFYGDGVSTTAFHILGVNSRSRNDGMHYMNYSPSFWERVKKVNILWGYCPSNRVVEKPVTALFRTFRAVYDATPFGRSNNNFDESSSKENQSFVRGNEKIYAVSAKIYCEKKGETGAVNGSLEPQVQSTLSCSSAAAELSRFIKTPNLCHTLGSTDWRFVRSERLRTVTCE